MTLLLSLYALIIYGKILITKFDKKSAFISTVVIALGLLGASIWGKRLAPYSFLFFLSALTLIFSFNQVWTLQIKRKFYSLPAFLFQIPLILFPLVKGHMSIKMSFLVFGFSFITGLLLEQFFSSPYPFSSFFEYEFYRSAKNKLRLPIPKLQSYLKSNLGNFVIGQLFVKSFNAAGAPEKMQFQKDLLPSLMIYWVSRKSFSSMHPLARLFNQISLDDIKENFTFYDLSNMDLPWIHDLFRCGCWKVGLYLLDQYLLTNKQSNMYASSILWSDRILNDLKRASFDEELIEEWLMEYRERFVGTPVSTKIQHVYHNKDDWFEKSFRFAAI